MKCMVLTIAYNAERTIGRTVDSILNQTHEDWIYYIVDNGSTDRTGELIDGYAKEHANIKALHLEKNDIWAVVPFIKEALRLCPEGEAFCFLDADDVYEPDFLETAQREMEDNRADFVVLGTRFLDAVTGDLIGGNVVRRSMTVTNENFGIYLPQVHWYFRQMWGKLYRVSVMRQVAWEKQEQLGYGGDTALVMQYLSHADTIRFVSQYGYHYYVSSKSSSYIWNPKRLQSDVFLYDCTMDVLKKKCGEVSAQNQEFMYAVHYNDLRDSLCVLLRAELPWTTQLAGLLEIWKRPLTRQMCESEGLYIGRAGWKRELIEEVANWLIVHAVSNGGAQIDSVMEIAVLMNPDVSMFLEDEMQFFWAVQNVPTVLRWLILGEYSEAFQTLQSLNIEGKMTDGCAIVLAQLLSAALSLEEPYVFYSKQRIRWNIWQGQNDEAENMLKEWESMLPGDADLIQMREMLTQ